LFLRANEEPFQLQATQAGAQVVCMQLPHKAGQYRKE